jgi:hypothetical protein
MTILLIAAAALGAILIYRHNKTVDPVGTDAAIGDIRQSVATIMVWADAAWSLFDALLFSTKPRGNVGGGNFRTRATIGSTASEVTADD